MFRLALALGESNPDRMLAQMPVRIWNQWQAYYQREPWGEIRADYRAAMLGRLLYKGFGGRGEPAIDDFLIVPPMTGTEKVEAFMQEMVRRGLARREQ